MSYSTFKKSMELAKQCRYYRVAGNQSEELITRVEKVFGFNLSPQHYEYYKKYGYIMFFGTEIYGIYDGVFEGVYAGNAVIATVQDRAEYKLPNEWIPIFDYTDGYIAYLDYGNLNSSKEPRVVLGIFTGERYEITEIIAEDLGDFILSLVEDQLDSQQE